MAMIAAPAGGLEAKHYILAALTATLVAAAVVTITSVVLSPARISFSVTEARSNNRSQLLPARSAGGGQQLLLTIAAANPSRRASVRYQSMFVDVSNNTGPQWVNWIRADVSPAMPLRQPPRNVTEIHAAAHLVGGPYTEDFTGNKASHNFSVRVTTVVRFQVGVAWTRLYDIRVYCGDVDFFGNKSSNASCHAA